MVISTFINFCKDFFMLIFFSLSSATNSLFQMNIFFDGENYIISAGHIFFAILVFSIVFSFIFSAIKQHFGGD